MVFATRGTPGPSATPRDREIPVTCWARCHAPTQPPVTMTSRHISLALLAILVLACSSAAPGPDIGRLPALTSADPGAEAAMREARSDRDAGRREAAEQKYERFLRNYSGDPLAVMAQLELGRMLLDDGRPREASDLFDSVMRYPQPAISEQGRFYGAVAHSRMGRHDEAAPVLRGLVGRTIDPADTGLLLLSLAESEAALDRYKAAVLALNKLLQSKEALKADQDAARARLQQMLQREGSPDQIAAAADALEPGDPALAPTLRRAIADAQAAGDEDSLRDLLERYQDAGLPMDENLEALAVRAAAPQEANPKAIGAILPLSGRARKVGELALRGLMLAANLPPPGPMQPDAAQLIVRDDGGDPRQAEEAVDELVNVHHVAAIVGPMDRSTASAAAKRAEELGVPLITLTPAAGITAFGDHIFQALPPARAEVDALVALAMRRGQRRLAVFHPDNTYGSALAEMFRASVTDAGGSLVVARSYPADETAFGKQIAELAKHRFDALFVPASSPQLALIAPALAAAGLWSEKPGEKPKGDGRAIQLLIPSVGFSSDLVLKSSRYLQGAAFSTVFAQNSSDPRAQAFADRFEAQFGSSPNAISAVAHDAYKLVQAASQAGKQTRSEVTAALQQPLAADTVALTRGLGSERTPTHPLRILTLDGEAMVDAM